MQTLSIYFKNGYRENIDCGDDSLRRIEYNGKNVWPKIVEGVRGQSDEAPSQQQLLEIPSLEQFMEWSVIQGFDSVQATASYYYIARHIKQVR